jgi:hypothetical protein
MLAGWEDRCWACRRTDAGHAGRTDAGHAGGQMLGMQGGQGMMCMVEDRNAQNRGCWTMDIQYSTGKTEDVANVEMTRECCV